MSDDLPAWLIETQTNSTSSTSNIRNNDSNNSDNNNNNDGGGGSGFQGFASFRQAQASNIHMGIGNSNLLSLVENSAAASLSGSRRPNPSSSSSNNNNPSNMAVPAGWSSAGGANPTTTAQQHQSEATTTANSNTNTNPNSIAYTHSRQPPPGPRHFGLVDPPRKALYRMMIRQLLSDGHSDAAMALAQSTGVLVANPGNNPQQLLELVNAGLTANKFGSNNNTSGNNNNNGTKKHESYIEDVVYGCDPYSAYDLPAQNSFDFREWYTSRSFDRPVRSIAFHQTSGKTVAVGTSNGDVRIYSTQLADEFARSATVAELQTPTDAALIRSLPGLHPGHSVETVGLHPTEPLCVSGGRDGRLVFTKYSQVTSTRLAGNNNLSNNNTAQRNVNNNNNNSAAMNKVLATHHDTFAVRCMAFHPSGETVLFGTDHNAPRLYHVESGSIFCPSFVSQAVGNTVTGPQDASNNRGVKLQGQDNLDPNVVHLGSITDVSYSIDGRHFASSSFDGSIRIFDGRIGSEVVGIHKSHCGVAVTSVELSRSGYMLLSAGLDSQVRIWDIRKPAGGNEIAAFATTGNAPKKLSFHTRARACFSHDEHSIIATNSTFQGIQYIDAATMRVTSSIDYWNQESSAKNPDKTGKSSKTVTEQESAAREEIKNGTGNLSSGVVRAVACAPNRCLLAAGGDDMRLRLWAPVLTTMK